MVGELVIAQAMLGQIVNDLPESVSARLQQTLDEVVHHTRELKDGVMSMRAQPVGAVFQRMPRLVRYVMEGLGTPDAQSADLMSYLLFDAAYTRTLVEIGYRDAGARIDELEEFLRAGRPQGSREAAPAA